MRFDEDALHERNPWKSISEAPDLPFRSFAELQAALAKGSYTLDISYIAARELAPFVRSVGGRLLNLLFAIVPLAMVIFMIVAAALTGRYVLFLGVLISVLAHFLGNPLNPLQGAMTILNAALSIGLLITVLSSNGVAAVFLAAFILPFSANRAMYASNVRALRTALAKSEALFLNLYSKGGLRLQGTQATPVASGEPPAKEN